MKLLDKIVRFIYLIGVMGIMAVASLMLYALSLILVLYIVVRGHDDFIATFNAMNKWHVELMKKYLNHLGV